MSTREVDPLSERLDELAGFFGRYVEGGLEISEPAALALREWALTAADDARAMEQALGERQRAAEESIAEARGNVVRLPLRRLALVGGLS